MSTGIKITLIDAATNIAYETMLNAEDFDKVQKDMNFATSLLEMLKKCSQASAIAESRAGAAPQPIAEHQECDVSALAGELSQSNAKLNDDSRDNVPYEDQLTPIEPNTTSDEDQLTSIEPKDIVDEHSVPNEPINPGTRLWAHAEILELLNIYKQHMADFTNGKYSQKSVWAKVAAAMQQQKYKVNGYNCNVKFASLKRTYKSIKDHNSKSGNGPRKWNYYENMDNLFNTKPWVAPLATASSADTEDVSSSVEAPQKSNAGKRKGSIIEYLRDTMAEKKKRSEQAAELNKEKLQKLDKMNDLLAELIKAQAPRSCGNTELLKDQ